VHFYPRRYKVKKNSGTPAADGGKRKRSSQAPEKHTHTRNPSPLKPKWNAIWPHYVKLQSSQGILIARRRVMQKDAKNGKENS